MAFVVVGRAANQGKYLQQDAVSWGLAAGAYRFQNRKDASDRAWEVQGTVAEAPNTFAQNPGGGWKHAEPRQTKEYLEGFKAGQLTKAGKGTGIYNPYSSYTQKEEWARGYMDGQKASANAEPVKVKVTQQDGGKWVAIANGKVVAFDPTLSGLKLTIQQRGWEEER